MKTFRERKNKSLRMILLTKNVNWKPSPPTPDALDDVKLSENKRDTPIQPPQNAALLNPLESYPYTNSTNNSPAMISLQKKVGGGGPLRRAKVYLLAANVYPQDELRGARKVELLRGNKVVGALVAPFPLHVE